MKAVCGKTACTVWAADGGQHPRNWVRHLRPDILRVTLSLQREAALAAPGYGIIAKSDAAEWSASHTAEADVYSSSRMVVTVARDLPSAKPELQTKRDIARYFSGSTPGAHIIFRTPEGAKLLELTGWSQEIPNFKSGTAYLTGDRRPI